jgi:hypothetical protein
MEASPTIELMWAKRSISTLVKGECMNETNYAAFVEYYTTLIDDIRKKTGDPNWTPRPALGQDGGFFINLRKKLFEQWCKQQIIPH